MWAEPGDGAVILGSWLDTVNKDVLWLVITSLLYLRAVWIWVRVRTTSGGLRFRDEVVEVGSGISEFRERVTRALRLLSSQLRDNMLPYIM